MSETTQDHSSDSNQDAAESLRDTLASLLGSAPAPEPELSDEELLAKIRSAAESAHGGSPE